jgi:hypothetical protein
MADFEEQLNLLLQEAADIYSPLGIGFLENDNAASKWMNDVQIFNDKYLKEHPLGQRMKTLLFHRPNNAVGELMTCLQSIQGDREFIDKMNGIQSVNVPKYQARTLPEYDVFISHANKDKEDLVEELYQSLKALGISIFYDKESLEWGDKWKDKILDGTKKAEFAIIVISTTST